MELEDSRTRTIELENRCRHLENIVQMKQQDVHTLQEVTYSTTVTQLLLN